MAARDLYGSPNKTRQGSVRERFLKPAGYFFVGLIFRSRSTTQE